LTFQVRASLERVALSANKPKPTATPLTTPTRGRPKGSRNRPKFAPPPALPPAALRVDDAARYLSVSPTTIRRAIRARKLPTRRLGQVLLIPVKALDAFLESGA
jgi:excisionase family DNA binding protein